MPTVLKTFEDELDAERDLAAADHGAAASAAPGSSSIDDRSLPAISPSQQNSKPALRTDTLAESVVVLLVLAGVQRIVGFARGVLVCRWLSPDQLGQWDMAFGFLTLGAPLAVLGLPGSFGRYVEYFRQRGQLHSLLRRTAIACAVLTALAVTTILLARPLFSRIVFGRPDELQLMLVLAFSLAAVIAFNYLTELITALRMARVTAKVQFLNSILFAGFSFLFLFAWQTEASALVAAYGLACGLQIFGMIWFLRKQLRAMPHDAAVHRDMAEAWAVPKEKTPGNFWPRLLSFAAWVWVSNLLYNLFDVADRYMIVHTSTAADPLAVVGSYHSSRIVPLLLVSIAGLMSTMILPHLSHDWESGRRQQVSARMNFSLKLLGLLLFCGSICILLGSPFLFDVAFRGKFAGGKDVMPWTLTYCSWFGLVTMAQLYLWCAERARLSCLALLLGLITNVALNCILLPLFGLKGAVWATAAANFTALAMIFRFNAWLGMKIERSMLLVALLPLSLGLGPVAALLTFAATILGIVFTNQILSADEKHRLGEVWQSYAAKLPWKKKSAASLQLTADGIHLPLPQGEGRGEGTAPNINASYLQSNQPSSNHSSSESRPIRVMFIITSMHIGGAETLLFNLLKRIDRTRFSPELCCTKEIGELGEELAHDIPVYQHLLKHKFDVRILGKLTRLLRRRQIDAVVTVGAGDKMFWGRLAARRAKVPVIISALHSTGWPDGINWLNRRLTPLNDAFVAVAHQHAEHLANVEQLPAKRVYIIPNGVDTKRYSPQPAKVELLHSLGISTSAPLAGIVAVLRPEKNHEMFLRVTARVRRDVPEAQFLIIGDGPRRTELELLATQLGITDCVHFLGKRADVPELLNLLDVFLLTSHNEANPVSILEAQACGKPVVATRVGSIAESVREGSGGYLVDPGDELQMAHHVASLLTDPAKAEHLGNAGRQNVIENWSIERMVTGYETLIETIYRRKTRLAEPLESAIEHIPVAVR